MKSIDRLIRGIGGIFIFAIRCYKIFLSPLNSLIFGSQCRCRFNPTCSDYAIIVLKKYGLFKALYLIIKRLIACNPFNNCDEGGGQF
ncbi:MAG: membrane protein insertion efficiency factor YidD [Puniceicoccales bacterium]|jgi:putative membrane protein insertion efficiency factor|nr:membrane protein insertion efficiency factor YidD [Puniceicoccales bacterium]